MCPGQRSNAWNPEAPFEDCPFCRPERSHAAIGPSEHFRSIVSRKDHNGVVGLANIFQVLQKLTDTIIHLSHTRLFDVVVTRSIHHRLILRRKIGEDVHASGIVPDEERFAIRLGLVHECRLNS